MNADGKVSSNGRRVTVYKKEAGFSKWVVMPGGEPQYQLTREEKENNYRFIRQ
jgi:hypothetical protein